MIPEIKVEHDEIKEELNRRRFIHPLDVPFTRQIRAYLELCDEFGGVPAFVEELHVIYDIIKKKLATEYGVSKWLI